MLMPSLNKQNGFSFIEVMAALAILSVALVAIIGSQSQSVVLVEKARDISFINSLARRKMVELEIEFAGKGFGEINEKDNGSFIEEELGEYNWAYEIKKIAIPVNESVENQGGGIGIGVIVDALNKSVRQLELLVQRKGTAGKVLYEVRLNKFMTSPKELPQINFSQGSGGQS